MTGWGDSPTRRLQPEVFMATTNSKSPKSGAARRQFIFDAAKMACGVGMLGLGLGLYAKQAKALAGLGAASARRAAGK